MEGGASPGRVLPGRPPHPQGQLGESAEEYDDSDDQQMQQALGATPERAAAPVFVPSWRASGVGARLARE
jgi:hypothetical protein